jgi:hypothetical protein
MTRWRLWPAALTGLVVQIFFTWYVAGWEAFRPLVEAPVGSNEFMFTVGRVSAAPVLFVIIVLLRNVIAFVIHRWRKSAS